MPPEGHDPTRYLEIAETLRGIARDIRFDECRVSQLNALADGFERLAKRIRHNIMAAAAD